MLHLGLPGNSTLCLEYQVSLLDVIPEYISLGHMLPQEIQPEWMKNAVHLMLHSAVEQVLILGETKVDKLAEGGPAKGMDPPSGYRKILFTSFGKRRLRRKSKAALCRVSLFELEGHILELLEDAMSVLEAPLLRRLELENAGWCECEREQLS
ncbi:hypothetical protein LOZ53_006495 [Ophidiomyces ophidiicola]|nr:hypothetical protein LOZ55_006686 [Ophidiomyces ophidiicola]KAI1978451.1 hypothetical protein LOZ54_006304 [Ophidiomyces ophidiicola]KAI1981380.1 hypothetical protein LOZ53_006495 [Ophidiomyces ophidiicola]KAI1984960.1 hypothetical protein LOZ51_006493 [Ophidiomyces ophidiicola]